MRLDRVLINGAAAASFPLMKVLHLPRVQSDHCPLLISTSPKDHIQSFFSFNPAWLSHPEFLPFVRDCWMSPALVNPLYSLHAKLKCLRSGLRKWNWDVFGDTNQKIIDLSKRIEASECALQREWTIDTEEELRVLRLRLNDSLEDQFTFLEAKSHVKWLKDGDRNTKFFHAAAKVRRAVNVYRVTLPDGSISDDREVIGSMAVSFFQDLLGQFSVRPRDNYFDNILPSVSSEENENLTKLPSAKEIHDAVLGLPKDSAPGPDGFSGSFFVACWDIIADDVIKAVMLFFQGFGLPASITSTVLTLVPKVKNASSLDQVRPISLCNFIHKIISKILNDRLRPLLSNLIGEEQFGFIPGRSIHHCIALAHDLTSDINKKVHGGNVMAKLDMSKAYDRVSWLFLIRAMRALGFSDKWCDLIYRNISNCWYSIRVRGKMFGHFKSNRGLRQGDPLSPALFIIVMEILTRKLNIASSIGGGVLPYWSSIRAMEINHILYADDILIFTNGGKTSFVNFLKVLEDFCSNSGQVLQPSKCKLFLSKRIPVGRQAELLRVSGYSRGSFPFRYLGAPLFHGPPRLVYFQGLVDAVKDRIGGWMKGFLSMAGRVTLIKSVLTSIPIHIMSVLPVPRGTIEAINKLLRGFLWSGGAESRRHWVSWESICKEQGVGGLGIRPLHHVMTGLRGKLAWSYLCNDSLWAKHARSRFKIGGKGSHTWRNISPYVTSIALDCHWRIGNGDTKAGVFCQNIALPCPRLLRQKSIREILANHDLRRQFIHNIPPRVFPYLNGDLDPLTPDKLIWEKDPSGVVTSRGFIRSFAPNPSTVRKFEMIWQTWIPLKVSCFLWRIQKNALATNDNVVRIGISMASRCVCCVSSKCESMEHIFMHGDMADVLWSIICPIFDRPRPRSLNHFFHDWGVCSNFLKFSDVFAFGTACLCLWEIWKIRCARVYDDCTSKFSRITVARVAFALAKVLPRNCRYDLRSRHVCAAFRLSTPLLQEFRVFWVPWQAFPRGLTCNFYIHSDENCSRVAAIVRNRYGALAFAFKASWSGMPFMKCLLFLVSELRSFGLTLSCIQSSQEDILSIGRDREFNMDTLPIKRRLMSCLSNVTIFRISFSLNKPAGALCFSEVVRVRTSSIGELPSQVQVAVAEDGFLHPCSSPVQQIYL